MTWIKICGNTSMADAKSAVGAGVDALGFVFAPSVRRVGAEAAAQIISSLPGEVARIGVFVNESPSQVAEIAELAALTGVQLQGDEAPGQLHQFRAAIGLRLLIKTLHADQLLDSASDLLDRYLKLADLLDAVLIDSGNATRRGGTGVCFEWDAVLPIVSRIQRTVPVIIAGGLNPANVAAAVRLFEPWGVDVASGVEREPGKKDAAKVQRFVASVRSAEPQRSTIVQSHSNFDRAREQRKSRSA